MPLAVQLPTVVLLGRQQMEHIVVIEVGYSDCQKPYAAWHMQIDPWHLVVSWAGHIKKILEDTHWLGRHTDCSLDVTVQ